MLHNSQENVNITARASCDHVTDCQGKRLIELCLATSLVIGNGRLHSDRGIGDFTFHSKNGSSVVDYVLLNFDDFDCLSNFCILPPNEFSDHSGLELSLTGIENSLQEDEISEAKTERVIKWDDSKIEDFKTCLSNNIDDFNIIKQMIYDNENIDLISEKFINKLFDCTDEIFGESYVHKINKNHTGKTNEPWFNNDGYEARNKF